MSAIANIEEFKTGTDNAIKVLKEQLSKIRTGRANVALLDGVVVDYYGTPTPLKQVANISTPDPRLIAIQAWEKNLLPQIEKAIIATNLGLTPQNDGKIIRLPIPVLTEERRKELVKQVRRVGENCKVAIRNQRRDINEVLKKMEKAKEIGEDDSKREQEKIQKETDAHIGNVDKITTEKEKEIMSV